MLHLLGSFKRIRSLIVLALAMTLVAAGFFFTDREQKVLVAKAEINYLQSYDLGAGYRLDVDNNGGQIVAPQNMLKSEPQPASAVKTIDLGDGYVLKLDANGGQIIPPASPFVAVAQPSYIKKIDIGSGYWLILTQDGGQIVKEGSR